MPERPTVPVPDPLPLPGPSLTEEVAGSLGRVSKETGRDPEETRERYCNLLQIYESGGSTRAFVELAADEFDIPRPASLQVVIALEDLKSVIDRAEEENALGTVTVSFCVG